MRWLGESQNDAGRSEEHHSDPQTRHLAPLLQMTSMKKDFKFKVERSPYLQVSAAMARGRCVLRHAAVVVACIALMLVSGVEGEADAAEVVERATDQEGLWSAPPAEGATRNRPGAQRGRLPWLRTAVLARNPQRIDSRRLTCRPPLPQVSNILLAARLGFF